MIVVLFDTHFLLLRTFINSALTGKKRKVLKIYVLINCVSHNNHFSPSNHNVLKATMVTIAYVGLFSIYLCIWYSNTLYCYIFSKFVRLYPKKEKCIVPKNPHLFFACSEPSPASYMVPCVYEVILNSFKKYKILVLYHFLVNFYGQGQFMWKSWYDYVIMMTSTATWLP